MTTKINNLARVALRQQVEFLGSAQVSLDCLWRACCSPEGRDPRRWSQLAAPLLSGFAAYLENLDSRDRAPGEAQLIWVWQGESKDPWRSGDTMSHEFIAWAYATYLDDSFERRSAMSLDLPRAACF